MGADKPIVLVNGAAFKPHTREDDTPELVPWRVADDLIKEGKLDEAAEHIIKNVDPHGRPPNNSMVFRVFMKLGDRLNDWLATPKPGVLLRVEEKEDDHGRDG